jgi:hypothetical protein
MISFVTICGARDEVLHHLLSHQDGVFHKHLLDAMGLRCCCGAHLARHENGEPRGIWDDEPATRCAHIERKRILGNKERRKGQSVLANEETNAREYPPHPGPAYVVATSSSPLLTSFNASFLCT